MEVRTKYSADKPIANAAPTCQNNLHCIRLFAFPQKLHAFLLPCASCIWFIGSDCRQIYFRLLQIHKSIKNHGENWNSHAHFLEWCWTEIHAESHTNFLIWKHEWSPKFKTLQIQIVVHVCSTPRRWKRSHS